MNKEGITEEEAGEKEKDREGKELLREGGEGIVQR